MSLRFRILALAAVLLAITLAAPALRAAGEDAPAELVGRLNATLLSVMQEADALGFEGRYDRLAPALSEAFDFPLMAKVSVGRHWRDLSPADRERLIEAFGRMSIATFAARFDGYGGERFRVMGVEAAPRGAVLVRNQLVKSDGEPVEINYLLRESEGRWRVVDVFLDAKYSELALKRSEYSAVIGNSGFEALLQSLDRKIAELAAEG